MSTPVVLASGILLVIGSLFVVVGGIGILRLPDFFARLHAAGLNDTLGAASMLIGLMVMEGLTLVTAKLALILFFLFFTSPTSTHALAKAALLGGLKPWTKPEDDPPSKT